MTQQQRYTHGTDYRPRQNGSPFMFPVVLVGTAIFIWLTGYSLPAVVASHFGASGQANGFMPREIYVRIMLGLLVFVSLFMVYLPGWTMNSPNARINLPNRDFWLAPERRQETIDRLRRSMRGAASLTVAFLGFVHWLVIQANKLVPPHMPTAWIIGGLAVFILSMLCWSWLLIKPFLNVPRNGGRNG